MLVQVQILARKQSSDAIIFNNCCDAHLVVCFKFELHCNVQQRKVFPCLKAQWVLVGCVNQLIPVIQLQKDLWVRLRILTVEQTNSTYWAMSCISLGRNKFYTTFIQTIWIIQNLLQTSYNIRNLIIENWAYLPLLSVGKWRDLWIELRLQAVHFWSKRPIFTSQ